MISLLLPTRGRPFLVERLFESIVAKTISPEKVEIVLCLDDDDSESQKISDHRLNIIKVIGPKTTMGTLNTRCLENASGNLIILMNDDLVIITKGWDQIIRDFAKKIPDEIFLAYPDDMEPANLSTFPILTRKSCDVIIEPYPAIYDCQFIDDHIYDIFNRLKYRGYDRRYCIRNVIFDHRHFIDGKARTDISYTHKNRYKDYLRFIALRSMRQKSADRLAATIRGEKMPLYGNEPFVLVEPESIRQAVALAFNAFIRDYGLPLTTRIRWFIRFSKYFCAMKKGISILKSKTYTLYGS